MITLELQNAPFIIVYLVTIVSFHMKYNNFAYYNSFQSSSFAYCCHIFYTYMHYKPHNAMVTFLNHELSFKEIKRKKLYFAHIYHFDAFYSFLKIQFLSVFMFFQPESLL